MENDEWWEIDNGNVTGESIAANRDGPLFDTNVAIEVTEQEEALFPSDALFNEFVQPGIFSPSPDTQGNTNTFFPLHADVLGEAPNVNGSQAPLETTSYPALVSANVDFHPQHANEQTQDISPFEDPLNAPSVDPENIGDPAFDVLFGRPASLATDWSNPAASFPVYIGERTGSQNAFTSRTLFSPGPTPGNDMSTDCHGASSSLGRSRLTPRDPSQTTWPAASSPRSSTSTQSWQKLTTSIRSNEDMTMSNWTPNATHPSVPQQHLHAFSLSNGSSRKRRHATEAETRSRNKLRGEGVCVPCRIRRRKCTINREDEPCDGCIKLSGARDAEAGSVNSPSNFPWCISVKPPLPDRNIFLLALPKSDQAEVVEACSYGTGAKAVFQSQKKRIKECYDELQSNKWRDPNGCRAILDDTSFAFPEKRWFIIFHVSNLLLSARGLFREKQSKYFNWTTEDDQNISKVRAVASIQVFKLLDSAIEKNKLEKQASHGLQLHGRDLVVFLAIVLDQVLSFEFDRKVDSKSDENVSGQYDKGYSSVGIEPDDGCVEELRKTKHNLQYLLAYYLRQLVKQLFPKMGVVEEVSISEKKVELGPLFWDKLMTASAGLEEKAKDEKAKDEERRSYAQQQDPMRQPIRPRPSDPSIPLLQIRKATMDLDSEQGQGSTSAAVDDHEDAKSIAASYHSGSLQLSEVDCDEIALEIQKLQIASMEAIPASEGTASIEEEGNASIVDDEGIASIGEGLQVKQRRPSRERRDGHQPNRRNTIGRLIKGFFGH